MGLASALNTSLTGLAAAEATFDVVGNNLANSNTVGFKSSQAVFATQFLQTQSLGSSPTDSRGGTNPRQFGLGVNVAAVTPNFTQGTIEISNNPSDLAIQGDGFFIVQGPQGEQRYTRSGIFQTNAQNELVTITGHRLLGHVADENFEIQTTTLQPISIPVGSTTVAHATEHVFLEGTLSPTGDIANYPEIIQSVVLSDGTVEVPPDLDPTDIAALSPPLTQASSAVGLTATPPDVTGVTGTPSAGAGTLAPGDYTYKIVYIDANGNEGVPSAATGVISVAGADNTVTLSNIPVPTGSFVGTRVYRSTTAGGAGPYARIGPDLGPFDTTFVDTGFAAGSALNEGTGLPASPPGPAVYTYKIVFVDADGNEGPPEIIPGVIDAAAGQRKVHLINLPAASAPFVAKRIYRSSTVNIGQAAGPFLLVSGDLPVGQATFTDAGIVGSGALNEQTLTPGNYGYYVTFVDSASGLETRPTALIGPQPINLPGRRIRIQNLPQPSPTGIFDRIKIYRNLSNNDTSFYEVADLPAGQTVYMDGASDAELLATNRPINLDGPPINPSLPLTELVVRSNNVYRNVFQEGTLSFTGHKGGQRLATKELVITSATTVQELITFVEQALGIVKTSPDPANPIPGNPGGRITADSRIEFSGNNGRANTIDIRLSGFQLRTATGVESVNLSFGSRQSAVGESAATDFIVYDSLGIPLNLRVSAVLESRDGTSTTYRWFADSPQNDPVSGVNINVGTGLVRFDGEGNIIDVTNATVSIDRTHIASQSPLEFDLDFSSVSGLSVDRSEIAAASQDGSGTGVLTSFIVGEDGRIRGIFSNGVSRDLAQIRLARFANNVGLEQLGENLYAAGVNSGLPIEADPGAQGLGTILAGSVELSNTDIGKNLIDLIVASTQYRGSARVITAAQQLLDELLNLRR